eukprot:ANDGO_04509.mRNA.1 Diphthine--ammonia ligase
MKLVALVSGGKDSSAAVVHAVLAGHEIVAFAQLCPSDSAQEELDSHTFQSVGHALIPTFASCSFVPLFQRPILGSSKLTEMLYRTTVGDEVEDLLALLSTVKKHAHIDGVLSGAIESDYQRLRIEHCCSILELVSVAPLWKSTVFLKERNQHCSSSPLDIDETTQQQQQQQQQQRQQRSNQTEIEEEEEIRRSAQAVALQKMVIDYEVRAIVIKVASMGLVPSKHLGRELSVLLPHFEQLHSKWKFHVCGEGGEYETLTLDAPFMHHRIVLDASASEMTSQDTVFAPVGHLHITKWHTEPKPERFPDGSAILSGHPSFVILEDGITRLWGKSLLESMSSISTSSMRFESPRLELVRQKTALCHSVYPVFRDWNAFSETFHISVDRPFPDNDDDSVLEVAIRLRSAPNPPLDAVDCGNQLTNMLVSLLGVLARLGMHLENICLVKLSIPSFSLFSHFNRIYAQFFQIAPPARAAVQDANSSLSLACYCSKATRQHTLHVQSVSLWAPACIGPYAQSVRLPSTVFCSGQIALAPITMQLQKDQSFTQQLSDCLAHVRSVLLESQSSLDSVFFCILYINKSVLDEIERAALPMRLQAFDGTCIPSDVVHVQACEALPRGAIVEILAIARANSHPPTSA